MSYQVLARKWRPKSFDALVGQEHVVRALTNALQQQRLHHTYLFTGTRGVGKTTLSRILAKSLNCELGVSAISCGKCAPCVAIDKGTFLDYVEMDAASNRGVEDMTSLLEKAIYAPTQGRYKVYMLDEVHQLTGHAFNAMLKTLEEPPAHVKFILATTDPQKVPVTILSRCLQFNLRQMSSSGIADYLQHVLGQENIAFEPVALQLIGRSANGSMRDALSLLDQAIAYGGDSVNEKEVRAMLGVIDQAYLFDLLNALLAHDANALLSQARAMEHGAISFDAALNDLANLLHKIAIAQAVPDSIAHNHPEGQPILDIATRMSAEEIQLYYQIVLLARRDLGLAPDEFAGFTMALLRMLAFNPGDQESPAKANPGTMEPSGPTENVAARATPSLTVSQPATKIAAPSTIAPSPEVTPEPAAVRPAQQPAPATVPATAPDIEDAPASAISLSFDGNWHALVDRLKLGMAMALAQNCELVSFDDEHIAFSVPPTQKHLLGMGYEKKLQSAIEQHFDRKIKMTFSLGGRGKTPAQLMSQEKTSMQAHAEDAIHNDDFVQALIKDFGAQIIPSSIKPLQ